MSTDWNGDRFCQFWKGSILFQSYLNDWNDKFLFKSMHVLLLTILLYKKQIYELCWQGWILLERPSKNKLPEFEYKSCHKQGYSIQTLPVPPLWSGSGLFCAKWSEVGPDFAEKCRFFIKLWKERLKCHILVFAECWLNNSLQKWSFKRYWPQVRISPFFVTPVQENYYFTIVLGTYFWWDTTNMHFSCVFQCQIEILFL